MDVMASYKPAPDGDLSSHVEDETPVPRHEFTEANRLREFEFDDGTDVYLACPDCENLCSPADLGEAVDWALGHKCADGAGGE